METTTVRTILLVDDEPNLLMGLQRRLRDDLYSILTVESGFEALELLASREVDVVISDQDMPGMSGARFLQEASQSYPHVVRFMLTGKATLEVALQAINEGSISRFFTKPCSDVELKHAIRQALEQKELMEEAWKLLNKVKRQESVLEEIEKEYPGISLVNRDADGVVQMDEGCPTDYGAVLKEIRHELHRGNCAPEEP